MTGAPESAPGRSLIAVLTALADLDVACVVWLRASGRLSLGDDVVGWQLVDVDAPAPTWLPDVALPLLLRAAKAAGFRVRFDGEGDRWAASLTPPKGDVADALTNRAVSACPALAVALALEWWLLMREHEAGPVKRTTRDPRELFEVLRRYDRRHSGRWITFVELREVFGMSKYRLKVMLRDLEREGQVECTHDAVRVRFDASGSLRRALLSRSPTLAEVTGGEA